MKNYLKQYIILLIFFYSIIQILIKNLAFISYSLIN
ncbi:MAG: hypothetical protein JWR12_1242 [Mucilaginibacter sp.]|nr:hypothetical protein [Mucilaginibacter sp.]